MASSSGDDVPRGLTFLFSRNRFNVAVSRAQCLAYLVCSPRLLEVDCRTIVRHAAGECALPLRGAGRDRGAPVDEATQLVLETLFDMRAVLYAMHDALIDPEDDDETTEMDS
jgi:hypothetical protein